MPGISELDGFYSAVEETARLLGVSCSRDKVRPILTTYQEALPQAGIAFRVGTGARLEGDLDCRFTLPAASGDPYEPAVANGLVAGTDHPVGALFAELGSRFPIDCAGIDFGVVDGFKKTWAFFPQDDLQKLADLAELPSMPRSLAAHLDFFARHGLGDKASLVGIDHRNRTVNIYFGETPAEVFAAKSLTSMLREVGLPEPTEQLLRLGEVAFGFYATLSWDSPRIERLCVSVITQDLGSLPFPIEPRIEEFSRRHPCVAADRRFVYAVAVSPDGEYHKLQSYYRWRPEMLDLMLLSDSVAD